MYITLEELKDIKSFVDKYPAFNKPLSDTIIKVPKYFLKEDKVQYEPNVYNVFITKDFIDWYDFKNDFLKLKYYKYTLSDIYSDEFKVLFNILSLVNIKTKEDIDNFNYILESFIIKEHKELKNKYPLDDKSEEPLAYLDRSIVTTSTISDLKNAAINRSLQLIFDEHETEKFLDLYKTDVVYGLLENITKLKEDDYIGSLFLSGDALKSQIIPKIKNEMRTESEDYVNELINILKDNDSVLMKAINSTVIHNPECSINSILDNKLYNKNISHASRDYNKHALDELFKSGSVNSIFSMLNHIYDSTELSDKKKTALINYIFENKFLRNDCINIDKYSTDKKYYKYLKYVNITKVGSLFARASVIQRNYGASGLIRNIKNLFFNYSINEPKEFADYLQKVSHEIPLRKDTYDTFPKIFEFDKSEYENFKVDIDAFNNSRYYRIWVLSVFASSSRSYWSRKNYTFSNLIESLENNTYVDYYYLSYDLVELLNSAENFNIVVEYVLNNLRVQPLNGINSSNIYIYGSDESKLIKDEYITFKTLFQYCRLYDCHNIKSDFFNYKFPVGFCAFTKNDTSWYSTVLHFDNNIVGECTKKFLENTCVEFLKNVHSINLNETVTNNSKVYKGEVVCTTYDFIKSVGCFSDNELNNIFSGIEDIYNQYKLISILQ